MKIVKILFLCSVLCSTLFPSSGIATASETGLSVAEVFSGTDFSLYGQISSGDFPRAEKMSGRNVVAMLARKSELDMSMFEIPEDVEGRFFILVVSRSEKTSVDGARLEGNEMKLKISEGAPSVSFSFVATEIVGDVPEGVTISIEKRNQK